jgi:uncharacterized protein YjbI with pentapeptide repeats
MANPEHLAILKRGVDAWNEWRERERDRGITADLSEADLSEADLNRVDLFWADLTKANLSGAKLTGAELSDAALTEANLTKANLTGAKLTRAKLRGANLTEANLTNAKLTGAYIMWADLRAAKLRGANLREAELRWTDLTEAKLGEADLREAVLIGACLRGADLRGADLTETDLSEADLRGADLTEANLRGADLTKANLGGANLTKANLTKADLNRADFTEANLTETNLARTKLIGAYLRGANLTKANLTRAKLVGAYVSAANLSGADLRNTDLAYSQLSQCDLREANLTGAILYSTAKEDWIIDGIQCKYVFWDANGRIRSPKDRDLAPGEFEQLYRSLPTIEYVFESGMSPMDPLIMDRVVQAIREHNPEFDIKIDSISARGLAPSIKFTVQQEKHKEPALEEVTRVYEARVRELAGRLDEARGFIQLLIDRPNSVYIENATGQYLAIGGSTINIDQHIEYINNLQDVVAAQAENSPAFAKVAKNTALDILGGALKDVAKGQVKEAAKQIYELGKELGPVVVSTAAYAFFRNCLG